MLVLFQKPPHNIVHHSHSPGVVELKVWQPAHLHVVAPSGRSYGCVRWWKSIVSSQWGESENAGRGSPNKHAQHWRPVFLFLPNDTWNSRIANVPTGWEARCHVPAVHRPRTLAASLQCQRQLPCLSPALPSRRSPVRVDPCSMSWLLWFPLFPYFRYNVRFPKINRSPIVRWVSSGQTNSVLFVLAFSALVTLGIPPTSLLSTDHLLDHILSSGLALILVSCSCKAEMLPSLGPLHYWQS